MGMQAYDRAGRGPLRTLPAAGGLPPYDAPSERRGGRLLLLRLCDRLPGAPWQRRGMGRDVAADPPGRRRLPGHERDAVQPAPLLRDVRRRRSRIRPVRPRAAVAPDDARDADPGLAV